MAKRPPVVFGAPPRVDLLPDAQRAEIHHEQTLPKLLLALLATAVVAGLIWGVGLISVMFANNELRAVEQESTQLTAQLQNYEAAQQLVSSVGSRSSDRQILTEQEVLFADIRGEILSRLPEGLALVRFIGELPSTDPEGGETLGAGAECTGAGVTVTITVSSPSSSETLARAATLIDSVREINGYVCDAFIDSRLSAAADASATDVQVRLGFDETVRAGRFVEEDAQ